MPARRRRFSRADTGNKEAVDLTARAARDELVELGAPAEVAEQVRDRLATVAHWSAPVLRLVMAGSGACCWTS